MTPQWWTKMHGQDQFFVVLILVTAAVLVLIAS